MDQFGVQKPSLRAIARTPALPGPAPSSSAPTARDTTPHNWLGARVRNIADEGEMSAFGLPGVTGVLVLAVSATPGPATAGLKPGDVIISLDGTLVGDVTGLLQKIPKLSPGLWVRVGIFRNQKQALISLQP